MKFLKIAALAAAAALSACGGGGDDDTATQSAAGVWDAADASILVTDSGEVWGIDEELNLLRGDLAVSGDKLTGSGTVYIDSTGLTASYSGSVQEAKTLTFKLTANGDTVSRNFVYNTIFDRAPGLSGLAGNYLGTKGETVVLSSGGALSGVDSGCLYSGTIAADTSGKNFYRVSVTFGAAPCAFPNGTATGVVSPTNTTGLLVFAIVGSGLGTADFLTKQ